MMEQAYLKAIEIFNPRGEGGGEPPAVVKDRRFKVQHDMLLVFKMEGLYVELQLHFVDTAAVKVLAHAVFEIRRLHTIRGDELNTVISSGLMTVMKLVPIFDPSAYTAKSVTVLLHI